MDEKQLIFDRKSHAIYSPKAKQTIQRILAREYAPDEAETLWEQIQLQYVDFLRDEPPLGGLKLASTFYNSILIFAWYAVVPRKPAIREVQNDALLLFMGDFHWLGKIFNLNRRLDMRIANAVFRYAMHMKAEEAKRFPASFHVSEYTFDARSNAVRYSFSQCPHAEFAKRHNMLDALPIMCNCDHLAMRQLHAGLIREGTCATGSVCDYCIVGDQNPLFRQYELVTLPNGLMVSRAVHGK
ncbi:MAG: L-2-amino-thiazoline-4-carboxylic acid hydrolase [Clostridia bacterium]|nr:L-2-amino-thiazoline-4-carboxylic acid hydrolase [Clostridia bacterium]